MSGGRIFKIQVNLDDMSASLDMCENDADRLQWLLGFVMGGRGVTPSDSASDSKRRGAQVSLSGYHGAIAFQKLQSDRGKKSAEARKSNGKSTTVEPRLNHGSNGTPNQSSNPVIHISNNPITTTGSGGIVDIDPDEMEDMESVCRPTSMPVPTKPPVSFFDWISAGHPRVALHGDNRQLWVAQWDAYRTIDNRIEIFDEMYQELTSKLTNPTHKLWPSNGQEWLMAHYALPKGLA